MKIKFFNIIINFFDELNEEIPLQNFNFKIILKDGIIIKCNDILRGSISNKIFKIIGN
jgi:hypothetical protein